MSKQGGDDSEITIHFRLVRLTDGINTTDEWINKLSMWVTSEAQKLSDDTVNNLLLCLKQEIGTGLQVDDSVNKFDWTYECADKATMGCMDALVRDDEMPKVTSTEFSPFVCKNLPPAPPVMRRQCYKWRKTKTTIETLETIVETVLTLQTIDDENDYSVKKIQTTGVHVSECRHVLVHVL